MMWGEMAGWGGELEPRKEINKDVERRYAHWFWNSRPVGAIADLVARLDAWFWRRRYGRH